MPFFTLTTADMPGTRSREAVKLLVFDGQLDESNVEENCGAINEMLETAQDKLIILCDLTKLEYISSKSMGYLIDWSNRLGQKGGRLLAAGMNANIMDLFTNMGIPDFIKCYASFSEAKTDIYK
jgi:anti-anti-sigma factor